jgi:hypothetical protein
MYGSTDVSTDEIIALTSIFDGSFGDTITVSAQNTNVNANLAEVYCASLVL